MMFLRDDPASYALRSCHSLPSISAVVLSYIYMHHEVDELWVSYLFSITSTGIYVLVSLRRDVCREKTD